MHDAVVADLVARPLANALVIHLGDYIDRGPASADVLARLVRPLPRAAGLPVINLLGNHEAMLLDVLTSGSTAAAGHWLQNGGGETLVSWGLSWRDRPADWVAGMPPEQLGFLRSLQRICRIGGYAFVHAGLRPGVVLTEQDPEDMLWIREPFLSHDGPAEVVAVHGHTPERAPAVRPHRIGVDTGAVLGGDLSCAVLERDTVGFLRT